MKQMEKEELKTINGGGSCIVTGAIVVAGIVFLVGIIDGFLRPYKCRE